MLDGQKGIPIGPKAVLLFKILSAFVSISF